MLDTATLEQRLITLEQVVFDLQHKVDHPPTTDNWLENLKGSVSDDRALDRKSVV